MHSYVPGLVLALLTVCLTTDTAIGGVPSVMPLIAQGGAGLVPPGGIEALAKPVRPNMVEAQPDAAQPAEAPANPEPPASPTASPLEIRYIISYVLMLAMISGSTFLVIRPSGRRHQNEGKSGAPAKAAAKKK